jgi:hypothetical protein
MQLIEIIVVQKLHYMFGATLINSALKPDLAGKRITFYDRILQFFNITSGNVVLIIRI